MFYDRNANFQKILTVISNNPGLCYTEVKHRTGLHNGTLSHHLKNLEEQSRILVKRSRKQAWFFHSDVKDELITPIIHLRKETSRCIILYLLENESADFKTLCIHTKRSPSTTSRTLTILAEHEIIKRNRMDGVSFEIGDREIASRALELIKPVHIDLFKERLSDVFSYF
jgi:predicted transcriptional regulator